MRCTLPCHVLREYPAQLLGNEYRNPGKHAVYPPPESVGPHTGCCRSKLNDISAAAPKAHALDPGPDAFHRREAINAQQTTASPAKAAKGRPRKRDRESTRNRSRRTVPQTVCGTVAVSRLWVYRRFLPSEEQETLALARQSMLSSIRPVLKHHTVNLTSQLERYSVVATCGWVRTT